MFRSTRLSSTTARPALQPAQPPTVQASSPNRGIEQKSTKDRKCLKSFRIKLVDFTSVYAPVLRHKGRDQGRASSQKRIRNRISSRRFSDIRKMASDSCQIERVKDSCPRAHGLLLALTESQS